MVMPQVDSDIAQYFREANSKQTFFGWSMATVSYQSYSLLGEPSQGKELISNN